MPRSVLSGLDVGPTLWGDPRQSTGSALAPDLRGSNERSRRLSEPGPPWEVMHVTEPLRLPALPLVDAALLPGMVLPVTLDGEAQAAVDAAQASAGSRLLAVPRLDGVYS